MSVQSYKRRSDAATVYLGLYADPTGTRRTAAKVVVPASAKAIAHSRAKTKVQQLANEERCKVESGTWAPPPPTLPAYTLNQLCGEFLAKHRTRRGQLAKDNTFYVERLKVWQDALGTRLASALTREEIEQVVARRRDGASTTRKNLRTLAAVFTWALKAGLVASSPTLHVAKPSEPRHKVHFLTDADEATLLAACGKPLARVIRFAIGTGLDREEIVNLTWDHFDGDMLNCPRAKTLVPRVIPMNEQLRQVLAECKSGMRSTSGRVFLKANGQPWTVSALKCAVKRAYARAGLKVAAPFKIFRHTFGTRLAASGAQQVVVRDLMGHTDTRTTDRYTHAYAEHLRDAMNSMDRKETACEPSLMK